MTEADPHSDDDAVFGVTPSLIVDFAEQDPGTRPDSSIIDRRWHRAVCDMVLAD